MHSPQFQALAIAGDSATFSGTAAVNGQAGIQFSVTVRDTLSIRLATGYTNQGQLTGGNIQIHKR